MSASASLGNLLVMQGGGPTQVINASLFGVIDEAGRSGRFGRVLGARFGMEGLIKGDFIDLSAIASSEIERLRTTPGAALGSTRYRPREDELRQLEKLLRQHDIRSLLLIGGNGSLRGVAALAEVLSDAGVSVIGIPKTIDNDITGTDRCPGYASAARYVAQCVRDLGTDVRTLPQPVSIFETMGRSVGWLAAAALLAKRDEGDAPHLIYLPERSFEIDHFLGDVDGVVRKNGWAIAVVAEGLQDASGKPIYETAEPSQRDSLDRPPPGGVSAHLAETVARRLKIRCRWEKPGLCGRCSPLHVSPVDRADAERVGRSAVQAAIERRTAHMVALSPLDDSTDEEPRCELVPVSQTGGERRFPAGWITDDEHNIPIAPAFVRYARRIVGELVDYPVPLNEKRC
jgi:6-phosphofructokinase 1